MSFHGFESDVRRLAMRLLLMVAVVGSFCAAQPVEARDRPGTPNQQALTVCSYDTNFYLPNICGSFNNTATEDIRIEMETTRNGAPVAALKMSCDNNPQQSNCNLPGAVYSGRGRYTLKLSSVDLGTQYCARFRARRVSDQVVSEVWSNYACVQTPPPPPAPSQPDFSVSLRGSQPYVPAGNATAGETATAKVIPTELYVTQTTASSNAVAYKLTEGEDPSAIAGWTDAPHTQKLTVAHDETSIGLNLCAYNASGHSCSHKLLSLEQSPGTDQTAAAPVPLQRSTRAIPPLPHARPIMPGVDLPGNDYSSKPIAGTAIDCQTACSLDGKCAAWTWVKPGVQNTQAMCWLKSSIPASVSNVNTTSGIKTGTGDR